MKLTVKELVMFPLLGAIMFVSKIMMDGLPNIHMVAMLIIVYTVIFRAKALIPIYIFVMLYGIYGGFGSWWIPYLYVWTVLWAVVMILPKNMKKRIAVPVYMVTGALHGLLFGTLYSPAQALLMGFDFSQTLAWIGAGFYFDVIHCVGNFAICALCIPLMEAFKKMLRR